MTEWIDNFTHSSITDENKDAFNNYAKNYATIEDAVIGGQNHKKMTGAPFKLPDSMDKLSDDAMRSDFTSKTLKLLGREPANAETIKSVNFNVGMDEGSKASPEMIEAFVKHSIDTGMTKAQAEKNAEFFNVATKQGEVAQKAADDAAALAAAEACDAALIAMPEIGNKEKLSELTELFKRAWEQNVGLTGDDVNEAVEAMAKTVLLKDPRFAKVMLDMFCPLAAEGQSGGGGGGGGGGTTITPYEWKKREWPKSESTWGKPEDTWENEPVSLRVKAKQAGIIK